MTRAPGALAAPPRAHRAPWLVVLALSLLLAPRSSAAQTLRPWTPPGADSIASWAGQARVRFQRNAGDSVGGENFAAYELVGGIGRRMVRALGRGHIAQAVAMESVIDSLGLSVEVRVDPMVPDFVLLMVHNPYKLTAGAVGFLYWFRGADLRTQGIAFNGGWRPAFRVWWSGQALYPYTCGIVEHSHSQKGALGLLLLRLSGDGTYWQVQQAPASGAGLGGDGEAAWVDVNSDGTPELVTWMKAPSDSLFTECSGCPALYDERILVERPEGFALHDSRLMPSPYASFQLFIRLLHQQNRAAAARLVAKPKMVDDAIALGWAAPGRPGLWSLEYTEASQWPRWLMMRFNGARDRPSYVVHFAMKEGRWIISDWGREPAPRPAPNGAPPASPGAPARADSSRGVAR